MSTATMPGISDEALTREFEEIFREHHQLVYRTAYAVTGSHQDAEDVLQTIFLKLLERQFAIDLRLSPKKYLYRSAVNLSLNIIRTRKRQGLVNGVEELDLPSPETEPDSEEEIQHRLIEAIAQLSPRVVEILILRYEHGYSDAEIAKMLGKSRGVIAVTLYRARARLKKLIHALSGEER